MESHSKKKSYLRYYLKQRIIDYKKKRLALKEKKNELQFEKALLKIAEMKVKRNERTRSSSSSSSFSSSSSSSLISNMTSSSRIASPKPDDVMVHNEDAFPVGPSLKSSTPSRTDSKNPSSTITSLAPESPNTETQVTKYDHCLIPSMELAVQIKNNEWKLPPLTRNQCRVCRKRGVLPSCSTHVCDPERLDLGCYCGFLTNSSLSFYGHKSTCRFNANDMVRLIKPDENCSSEKVSSPMGSISNLDPDNINSGNIMNTGLGEKQAFEDDMLDGNIVVAEESLTEYWEEDECIEWINEEEVEMEEFEDARPTSMPRRSTM
ncbi:uncharacterized protein LOC119563096 [Drosophila subpulchrella]|uniref:uncharacterized protein LOC119563096 n=1 Tax=Drosophila subpulchrella TaxID=1486046 RepID=UPI0018A18296|nr:uncharacterized protein LOC119563096 [Drosophila subpulchrella]